MTQCGGTDAPQGSPHEVATIQQIVIQLVLPFVAVLHVSEE